MDLKEKAYIIHFHRHRQEAFDQGTTGALGWKSDQSQQARYGVLAGIGDLNHCTVLEPGCGYADLLAFLDRQVTGLDYIGVDLLPEFLETAACRYAQRGHCRFFQGDFSRIPLPEADWVLASGTFGYKTADTGYYTRCIERFFRTAAKGVGFNMLDREKFGAHPLLTGHDRDQILAFCRSLSPRVRLMEGYAEDDFTVLMYKPGVVPGNEGMMDTIEPNSRRRP